MGRKPSSRSRGMSAAWRREVFARPERPKRTVSERCWTRSKRSVSSLTGGEEEVEGGDGGEVAQGAAGRGAFLAQDHGEAGIHVVGLALVEEVGGDDVVERGRGREQLGRDLEPRGAAAGEPRVEQLIGERGAIGARRRGKGDGALAEHGDDAAGLDQFEGVFPKLFVGDAGHGAARRRAASREETGRRRRGQAGTGAEIPGCPFVHQWRDGARHSPRSLPSSGGSNLQAEHDEKRRREGKGRPSGNDGRQARLRGRRCRQ